MLMALLRMAVTRSPCRATLVSICSSLPLASPARSMLIMVWGKYRPCSATACEKLRPCSTSSAMSVMARAIAVLRARPARVRNALSRGMPHSIKRASSWQNASTSRRRTTPNSPLKDRRHIGTLGAARSVAPACAFSVPAFS